MVHGLTRPSRPIMRLSRGSKQSRNSNGSESYSAVGETKHRCGPDARHTVVTERHKKPHLARDLQFRVSSTFIPRHASPHSLQRMGNIGRKHNRTTCAPKFDVPLRTEY